jgi:hypothetical protein
MILTILSITHRFQHSEAMQLLSFVEMYDLHAFGEVDTVTH